MIASRRDRLAQKNRATIGQGLSSHLRAVLDVPTLISRGQKCGETAR